MDTERRRMSEAERPNAGPLHDRIVLRRAERLLRELTGVVSARIVADSDGRIQEIHILTDHEIPAKQTVRNVESALQAQLGIQVDHRKVSVARTRGSEDEAAGKIIGIGEISGQRRYLLDGYEFKRKMPLRVECRVRLRLDEREFVGVAEGTDMERGRLNAAAQAALNALQVAESDAVSFALEGVALVDAFDPAVVTVALYGLSGRNRNYLAGAAPVVESAEYAAILAALQATNRWILSIRR